MGVFIFLSKSPSRGRFPGGKKWRGDIPPELIFSCSYRYASLSLSYLLTTEDEVTQFFIFIFYFFFRLVSVIACKDGLYQTFWYITDGNWILLPNLLNTGEVHCSTDTTVIPHGALCVSLQ